MTGEERLAELDRLRAAEDHRLWLLLEPHLAATIDRIIAASAPNYRDGRASCLRGDGGICIEHGYDPLRCPLYFHDAELEATG